MVLMVHGGPWGRDSWGYNPMAQWFANRGYACLKVNFRASTGYGKAFLNAGNKQWGKTMHDDLIDACNWAVAQGYADPKKIAIFGGSYGGYAALAGVTFTPEFFACAVDIVGPSNLKTLIGTIPPYWKPMRSMFDVRLGNVDDPKDAELIKDGSPLFKADKIQRPLADRPGSQRSPGQAGRVRADRGRHREERRPRDLRALSRRGPRLRPAREPDRLQRPRRGLPGREPGRPLRADERRQDPRLDGGRAGGRQEVSRAEPHDPKVGAEALEKLGASVFRRGMPR